MGFLARLFGDCGTVRFEGTTFDGRHFKGKTDIESFGMSKEEIEAELKNALFVKNGVRAKELRIIGFA